MRKHRALNPCSPDVFPSRLRETRQLLGLTQAELAARCGGWSPAVISMFECGQRAPSLENFTKLCNGLDCSPELLLLEKIP